MNKGIENLINNPLIKAALFKQLTKVMKENNVTLITLSLDENGKMKVETYLEDMKTLPMKDFNTILYKTLNSNNDGND
jgi:hypothetical protein